MLPQMVDIDGHMIRPEDVSAVTALWHNTQEASDHFVEKIWSGFTVHFLSKGTLDISHSKKSSDYMSKNILKKDFEELDAEMELLRKKLLDAIEEHPRQPAPSSINDILVGTPAA